MRPCPDCETLLEHCHGTLILHVLGFVECSDPDCRQPRIERHAAVLECDAATVESCGIAECGGAA